MAFHGLDHSGEIDQAADVFENVIEGVSIIDEIYPYVIVNFSRSCYGFIDENVRDTSVTFLLQRISNFTFASCFPE